jgi:hypothetical protein
MLGNGNKRRLESGAPCPGAQPEGAQERQVECDEAPTNRKSPKQEPIDTLKDHLWPSISSSSSLISVYVCTAEARACLVFPRTGHLQTHSWILARLSVRC